MNKNNVYEVGFLVNPDLSQQEAEQTVENIKKILEKNGASVISEGEVVNIELAYQIVTKINSKNERFNEAYFSWIKFSVEEASQVEILKPELDKIKKDVFRYLLVKTDKDDAATDKFVFTEEKKQEEEDEKIKEEIEKSEDIIEEKKDSEDDI